MKVAAALFALAACTTKARAIDAPPPPPPADAAIDAPVCGAMCNDSCPGTAVCCMQVHAGGELTGSCVFASSTGPTGCSHGLCQYLSCTPNMPCTLPSGQPGTCTSVNLSRYQPIYYWVCQ